MLAVRMWCRRVVRCAVSLILFIPLVALAASYVYDANGRLRAVTSSSGASSEYIYDALGNIYAINSIPAGQLAIFAFTPNHGSIGTTVTIAGQGFSTTPASNVAKFNGVAATVSSPATATQLKVTVPTGATTGTISVQVGTATTTSVDVFTVTADAGVAPTISSFTPAVIASGGAVTVNGSHFVTTAGATTGAIGEMNGTVSSLTDGHFTLTASSDAASGFITATTPYGSALSAQPLVVLPAGISASQITGVDYLTINGSAQTLNVSVANSYGAYVFQGSPGQYLSLQFSSITPTSGVICTTYDPAQRAILSSLLGTTVNGSPNAMTIHFPVLTDSGSYLILCASGSSTAQVTGSLVSDPVVLRDGSSVALATTTPWQSIRALSEMSTGQNQSLGISSLTSTPTSTDPVNVQVFPPESLNPQTTNVSAPWSVACYIPTASTCQLMLFQLETAGTYATLISSAGADTLSLMGTLSSPSTSALTLGTAKSFSVTRNGQTALLSFSANAGDRLVGYLNTPTTSPAGGLVSAVIVDANGISLPGPNWSSYGTGSFAQNYPAIPATGTYQVLLGSQYGQTFSGQFTVARDTVKALTIDGTAQSVSTTVPGANAYLTFNATAGQNLSLALYNGVYTPNTATAAYLTIYTPDGNTYQTSTFGTGNHYDLLNVPQTGTYSVTVQPQTLESISFTAAVMNAVTGSLTIGTAKSVSLTKPGQTALFTFNANAGDLLGGYLYNPVTSPSGDPLAATVLNTNGTQVSGPFWGFYSSSSFFQNYIAIPTTGTYEVLIEPLYTETSSAQFTIARDQATSATINGAAVNMSSTDPGQSAYITFSGSANQNVRFNVSSMTSNPANLALNYVLTNSAGTSLVSSSCGPPTCNVSLPTLPANDTYMLTTYVSAGTFSYTASLLSP